MFRRILLSLALLAGATLGAADVAATLLKVSGGGELFGPDGKSADFKAGVMVQPGSRLVTREGGLAVLLMADGSRVSVGPNTDLTLSESKEDAGVRSTVFDLVKGLFRATVQKLTLGSAFQVKTADAVAAVKGTDFEVSTDEAGTEARVSEGTVWMQNAAGERAVIEHGMAAHCGHLGRIGETRRMSEDELRNFGSWAHETLAPHSGAYLPADEAKREAWARLRPDQRRQVVSDLAHSMGEDFWHDVAGLNAEERQERWRDRLRNVDERRLAAEGARVDFALGKCAIDRQGRRVRFDEFLVRPSADQLQFLNYTRRGDRTDLLSAINTYNTALPQSLADAPGLNQRIWLQTAAPRYWIVNSSLVAGNSAGDSFAMNTSYYDPYYRILAGYWELPVESAEVRLNIPDLNAPTAGGMIVEQWVRQGITAGGPVPVATPTLGLAPVAGVAASTQPLRAVAGTTNNMVDPDRTNLMWALGPAGTEPLTTLLDSNGLEAQPGDLAVGFTRTYRTTGVVGVNLEFRLYVINENGQIVNLAGIPPDQLMDEFVKRGLIASLEQVEIRSNQFQMDDGINVVSKLLFLHDLTKTQDQL
jgi:hypothetical protein